MIALLLRIGGMVATRLPSITEPIEDLTDGDPSNDPEAAASLLEVAGSIVGEVVDDKADPRHVQQLARGLADVLEACWLIASDKEPKRVRVRLKQPWGGWRRTVDGRLEPYAGRK